jgi:LmbE family N-acetylglucosaminyl deacetylase
MLECVLVVAPHPDDDAIACGALLQRAQRVRILFVTDGERNPWPQRVKLRKLFIGESDRAQWAALRRAEVRNALARLGLDADCARFLGLPDQGLMSRARRGDRELLDALQREIRELQPTLIVSPSSFDAHCDHRAIAWYVHVAQTRLSTGARTGVAAQTGVATGTQTGVSVLHTYVIHGAGPPSRVAFTLDLTSGEQARKRDAIRCHESQLLLSRDRFLSYATPSEQFYEAEHDLVRVESWLETTLKNVKHAWFVVVTRQGARHSHVQAAADVQHGAGDVRRLL